jgi:hypothetical protein
MRTTYQVRGRRGRSFERYGAAVAWLNTIDPDNVDLGWTTERHTEGNQDIIEVRRADYPEYPGLDEYNRPPSTASDATIDFLKRWYEKRSQIL